MSVAACSSQPARITVGQCWSVSAGDRIEGAAILYIPSPFSFHIGPKLGGGENCPRYPISLVNQAARDAYRAIDGADISPERRGAPREIFVLLTGAVVSGDDGSPAIRVTRLRQSALADTEPKPH
ncbi:hypothetical protein FHR19_000164 [Sphingomonas yantingensis]|uniref:Uncharacterized protein n=1 Tax=Sphingomonas yantingensis TaxID=1241761 RepID=A0A7W9EGE7_9SPHN|nr:hypothetical protein [Sphingomonas yantingensis]